MPVKRRRIKRIRRIQVPNQVNETASQRFDRVASNYISDHPQRDLILKAMREGIPNSDLARDFIIKGYFDINQKTAVQYLQRFRKNNPKIVEPREDDDMPGYDHLFNGMEASPNPETELVRLIRLQKSRIGMSFETERGMTVLLSSTNKEITVLRELLMDLAKLRGIGGTTSHMHHSFHSDEVKAELAGLEQEENQKDQLASMVMELIGTQSNGKDTQKVGST